MSATPASAAEAPATTDGLRMEGVTAGYLRNDVVLEDVTIQARPGKVTAVLGPNGSGKSTSLRVMYGFLAPRSGRVLLDGRDVTGLAVEERLGAGISFLPQGRSVFPRLTVEENLRLGAWRLRRHQAELRDLIEMRAAIESQALRGAAGDLGVMASEATELLRSQSEAIADGRLDDAAEADMRFHLRLAGSTENRPLRLLAEALIGRARQAAHAAYRVSAYRRASLRQHRSIVAALKAGDRDRAADLLMEHHLSRVDQLASYLERSPEDAVPG